MTFLKKKLGLALAAALAGVFLVAGVAVGANIEAQSLDSVAFKNIFAECVDETNSKPVGLPCLGADISTIKYRQNGTEAGNIYGSLSVATAQILGVYEVTPGTGATADSVSAWKAATSTDGYDYFKAGVSYGFVVEYTANGDNVFRKNGVGNDSSATTKADSMINKYKVKLLGETARDLKWRAVGSGNAAGNVLGISNAGKTMKIGYAFCAGNIPQPAMTATIGGYTYGSEESPSVSILMGTTAGRGMIAQRSYGAELVLTAPKLGTTSGTAVSSSDEPVSVINRGSATLFKLNERAFVGADAKTYSVMFKIKDKGAASGRGYLGVNDSTRVTVVVDKAIAMPDFISGIPVPEVGASSAGKTLSIGPDKVGIDGVALTRWNANVAVQNTATPDSVWTRMPLLTGSVSGTFKTATKVASLITVTLNKNYTLSGVDTAAYNEFAKGLISEESGFTPLVIDNESAPGLTAQLDYAPNLTAAGKFSFYAYQAAPISGKVLEKPYTEADLDAASLRLAKAAAGKTYGQGFATDDATILTNVFSHIALGLGSDGTDSVGVFGKFGNGTKNHGGMVILGTSCAGTPAFNAGETALTPACGEDEDPLVFPTAPGAYSIWLGIKSTPAGTSGGKSFEARRGTALKLGTMTVADAPMFTVEMLDAGDLALAEAVVSGSIGKGVEGIANTLKEKILAKLTAADGYEQSWLAATADKLEFVCASGGPATAVFPATGSANWTYKVMMTLGDGVNIMPATVPLGDGVITVKNMNALKESDLKAAELAVAKSTYLGKTYGLGDAALDDLDESIGALLVTKTPTTTALWSGIPNWDDVDVLGDSDANGVVVEFFDADGASVDLSTLTEGGVFSVQVTAGAYKMGTNIGEPTLWTNTWILGTITVSDIPAIASGLTLTNLPAGTGFALNSTIDEVKSGIVDQIWAVDGNEASMEAFSPLIVRIYNSKNGGTPVEMTTGAFSATTGTNVYTAKVTAGNGVDFFATTFNLPLPVVISDKSKITTLDLNAQRLQEAERLMSATVANGTPITEVTGLLFGVNGFF